MSDFINSHSHKHNCQAHSKHNAIVDKQQQLLHPWRRCCTLPCLAFCQWCTGLVLGHPGFYGGQPRSTFGETNIMSNSHRMKSWRSIFTEFDLRDWSSSLKMRCTIRDPLHHSGVALHHSLHHSVNALHHLVGTGLLSNHWCTNRRTKWWTNLVPNLVLGGGGCDMLVIDVRWQRNISHWRPMLSNVSLGCVYDF